MSVRKQFHWFNCTCLLNIKAPVHFRATVSTHWLLHLAKRYGTVVKVGHISPTPNPKSKMTVQHNSSCQSYRIKATA